MHFPIHWNDQGSLIEIWVGLEAKDNSRVSPSLFMGISFAFRLHDNDSGSRNENGSSGLQEGFALFCFDQTLTRYFDNIV